MKFNASTDPKLSEPSGLMEMTMDQNATAHRMALQVVWERHTAAREIIALRAALEQHAEALRAAKLAGWRAGIKAACAGLADSANEIEAASRAEPRGSAMRSLYESEADILRVALSDTLHIAAPTPSQLDEIR